MFRFISILVLCSSSVFAQSPFSVFDAQIEIPQKQITFLRANSASLIEDAGKILIVAEDLDPVVKYGVEIQLDKAITYVEIFDVIKPFPPRILKPLPTGQLIVVGEPGQKFYIRIPSEVPQYAEIVVLPKGTTPPITPNPPITNPNLKQLTDLSREKASKLDKETGAAIKKVLAEQIALIENKCASGLCPTKDEASKQVIDAINLIKKNQEYDWFVNWRVPVSDAVRLVKPVTTQDYLNAMKAVGEGL